MYRRLQGVVSSEYYDSGSKSESLTAILCKVYIPLRHVSIRGLPRPSKYPVKGGKKNCYSVRRTGFMDRREMPSV